MNKYSKSFLALTLSLATLIGAAGMADARWGGPGCGPMSAPTPEARQMMENAFNAMAPLIMELRAKQDELTAKIYGGADAKTIEALSKEVISLQTRVTEGRVAMQQQFAKAGIPMQFGQGGCMPMGSGPHGAMNTQ